jgi:hypothetical protein
VKTTFQNVRSATFDARHGDGRDTTFRAGVVDPVTGELVPFPYLSHPRAGLSNTQWRALSPGEKVERLLNMPLDRAAEILTWPLAELDPLRLSLKMQVMRIILMIGIKALLDGSLDREVARETRARRDAQKARARLAPATSLRGARKAGAVAVRRYAKLTAAVAGVVAPAAAAVAAVAVPAAAVSPAVFLARVP